jgi:hypothetical protein
VPTPTIVSVARIWDAAPHNAFTGLARWRGRWWCTFREASAHVPGTNGKIRVIASDDGETWDSAALLAEPGIDLRDPKVSVAPGDRLMLSYSGSVYGGDEAQPNRPRLGCRSRVALSDNGIDWDAHRVGRKNDWLWRVTWHEDTAQGLAVGHVVSRVLREKGESDMTLWRTTDGIVYEPVVDLPIPGYANETTLRFLRDDRMIALVRREEQDRCAWIGTAPPPYTDWSWHVCGHRVGGPDFIVLPDGRMFAAGRAHGPAGATTVLARFGPTTYEPVLTFPSGGDCSYPGLVWHDGMLWMSYYSSHEDKTCIYLAKVAA